MENFYITIAGPIGVGKTTVAELLGKTLSCQVLCETVVDHPYLDNFYASMTQYESACERISSAIEFKLARSECLYYSSLTQIHFLFDRFWKHLTARVAGSVIGDRSIYEDEIFARLLVSEGKMEETFFFQTYLPHFAILTGLLRPPDIMVILEASVDTLMSRILKRNRGIEQGIPRNYISKLNTAYCEWSKLYNSRHNTIIIKTDTQTPKNIVNLIQNEIA